MSCCVNFRKRKKCFAPGCAVRTRTHFLMCREHWQMVSALTRVMVYAGLDQWEQGGSPRAYLEAIKLAHGEVKAAELRKARA